MYCFNGYIVRLLLQTETLAALLYSAIMQVNALLLWTRGRQRPISLCLCKRCANRLKSCSSRRCFDSILLRKYHVCQKVFVYAWIWREFRMERRDKLVALFESYDIGIWTKRCRTGLDGRKYIQRNCGQYFLRFRWNRRQVMYYGSSNEHSCERFLGVSEAVEL